MFGIDDALSAVAGWFGAEQQNRRQADAAEQANSFSAQQFATRYQTTTRDMQAAGLNPMLAYSQGGGSPPSGVQANVPVNSGEAASRSYSAYQANKLIDAQINVANAQAGKIKAETPTTGNLGDADINLKGASAEQSRANIGLINKNVEKVGAEIENVPKEGIRLVRAAEALYQQGNLAYQQQLTETQKYDVAKATASKLVQEGKLTKADVDAMESWGNSGRITKEILPFIQLLRSIIR